MSAPDTALVGPVAPKPSPPVAMVQHIEVQHIDGRDLRVLILSMPMDAPCPDEGAEVRLGPPTPSTGSATREQVQAWLDGAEFAPGGTWRGAGCYGAVITDADTGLHDDVTRAAYGGAVVCESASPAAIVHLIASRVAVPTLAREVLAVWSALDAADATIARSSRLRNQNLTPAYRVSLLAEERDLGFLVGADMAMWAMDDLLREAADADDRRYLGHVRKLLAARVETNVPGAAALVEERAAEREQLAAITNTLDTANISTGPADAPLNLAQRVGTLTAAHRVALLQLERADAEVRELRAKVAALEAVAPAPYSDTPGVRVSPVVLTVREDRLRQDGRVEVENLVYPLACAIFEHVGERAGLLTEGSWGARPPIVHLCGGNYTTCPDDGAYAVHIVPPDEWMPEDPLALALTFDGKPIPEGLARAAQCLAASMTGEPDGLCPALHALWWVEREGDDDGHSWPVALCVGVDGKFWRLAVECRDDDVVILAAACAGRGLAVVEVVRG